MNKQILICLVAIIAFAIGFHAGKNEYFYMSKKECITCRETAYNKGLKPRSECPKECFY